MLSPVLWESRARASFGTRPRGGVEFRSARSCVPVGGREAHRFSFSGCVLVVEAFEYCSVVSVPAGRASFGGVSVWFSCRVP